MPLTKSAKNSFGPVVQKGKRIVTFTLSGGAYAIDIRFISEIIYSRVINPLPGISDYVEGIIDLRGLVVPVLDLKKRLKLPLSGFKSDHIIIAKVHQITCGILVDQVAQVLLVQDKEIQITKKFMNRPMPYLEGVCRSQERLILLLDLESLWSEIEMSRIESDCVASEVHSAVQKKEQKKKSKAVR